jgi:molybdopterin biosynthesis enzyme
MRRRYGGAAGVAAHPAGTSPEALAAGSVARIFTGAPVPAGADAIVMQEDCELLEDGRVRIKAQPVPGSGFAARARTSRRARP